MTDDYEMGPHDPETGVGWIALLLAVFSVALVALVVIWLLR